MSDDTTIPRDEATFTGVEVTYNASPERAAVFADFPGGIAEMEIGFAEDVTPR